MSRRTWGLVAVAVVACALLLASPVTAGAARDNGECSMCHGIGLIGPDASFTIGAVDRETACRKCHIDTFVGTHPNHYAGGDCGSVCHLTEGFGYSIAAHTPTVLTAGGAFASAASNNAPATTLHAIHNNPRWMADKSKPGSKCGSCHAVAACTACHEGSPQPHQTHAEHGNAAPWVGNVSFGVPGGDMTVDTMARDYEQGCGAVGCHDINGIKVSRPYYIDCYTHPAYPDKDYIDSTGRITRSGTWTTLSQSTCSLGREIHANSTASWVTVRFTGERVTLYATKDNYRGIGEILIDGVPRGTYDAYSELTYRQRPVWISGDLGDPDQEHTITIRPTGTKNPASRGFYVALDHIGVDERIVGSIAPQCASCHPVEADPDQHYGSGVGDFTHDMTQTIVATNIWDTGRGQYSCDKCHKTHLSQEHLRPTSSGYGAPNACSICHPVYAATSWSGTYSLTSGCEFGECHSAASGRERHARESLAHQFDTVGESTACIGCHGNDVSVVHNNSVPGNGFVETEGCLGCHGPNKLATAESCTASGCHPNTHNSMATHVIKNADAHTAATFTRAYQGDASLDDGGRECATCHSAQLFIAHSGTSVPISCSSGGSDGLGCHLTTKFNAPLVAAASWPTRKCTACHNDPPYVSHDETATAHFVTSNGCAGTGASCHNSNSLWTLHLTKQNGDPAAGQSCANIGCHDTLDRRPTVFAANSCGSTSPEGLGCHRTYTPAHATGFKHAFSSASYYNAGSESGCTNQPGCHGDDVTEDFGSVYHPATGCFEGACHQSPSKAAFTGLLPTDCQECHTGGAFSGAPARASLTSSPAAGGHYSETTHTASGLTATVSAGGSAIARCVDCHDPAIGGTRAGLLNQHTAMSVPGSPYGATMGCGECHGDTRANGAAQVAADWPSRTCAACHTGGSTSPLDHAAAAPAVAESGSSCGGISGCHTSTDLHQIHRNASGCALTGCHDFSTQAGRPSVRSCGQGNGGCHLDKTVDNHGADHGYTAASDYNDATVSGCANSGPGCHGFDGSRANAVDRYHTAGSLSCMSSACHTSPTMDAAWKANNTGAECAACHAGDFAGAPDRIALYDVYPNGHYSETTHTISGLDTAISAGGTYSATCADCHNPVDASGPDGLLAQHKGLKDWGTLTCSGCHNKNAAIQAIVTDGTRTDTCAACHAVEVQPTMVMHAPSAPVTIGTEAGGAGSCQSAGCHATLDIHALHKSNLSGGPNGCTMAGCHDAAKQGWKPALTSCGSGGDCHDSGPIHPAEAVKHTTIASGASCVVCHESGDLKIVHGDDCGTCHGNPSYPALPTGKLECTSCHNGVDVGMHVYDPYDPNHYMAAVHTAGATEPGISNTGGKSCDVCHVVELKPEHAKASTSFDLGGHPDICVACHEVAVDSLAVTPWTAQCQACHAPATVHTGYTAKHDFSAGNAACAGADCHDVSDAASLHSASLPGAGDCVSCHASTLAVPTQTACTDCHAAHPAQATVHASSQSECTSVCHASKADIATGHASCATCHANPALVDYLKNNYTATCTDCHNTSLIGLKTYSPFDPNHYGLAIHTASPFTFVYQSNGADGPVPAETKECSTCHTGSLKAAHASTSTNGGSVTCTECHSDTTLNSTAVIAGDWPTNRCTDCHDHGAASTHDGMTTVHVVSTARGCAGSGTSCHNLTDLAKLHNVSQSGGTPKYASCANTGCHVTKDLRPSPVFPADSCGQGSTGCHTDKTTTNHGGKHTLDVTGSNYNNATISGCTNSGDGCHGFNASTSITAYHPDSGCTEGPCHTSPSKPSKTEPFTCQTCHNGTFINAVDTVGLTDGAPDGHYSEATHTIGVMTDTVSAGGTYSATCATCHDPVSPGSIDGLYVQHQNLNLGLGDTTCSDCHNYNAAIQTIVTDTTRDGTCASCHNASVLPTMVMHGATAPVVSGSEAGGAGSCVRAGCHLTLDLHALHKSDLSGGPNGCTMTGCHDATRQGWKPTPNSCGLGGDCHTTDPHNPAAHITTASAACVVCHESTDLRVVHGQSCALCHGNPSYPTLPAGKLECLDCHVPGTVGAKTYTPVDPNHYLGTETSHTASAAQASDTYSGFVCTTCHLMELKPEHDKANAAFPTVPGTHANKCIACHELRVDGFTLPWTRLCANCHTVKHGDYASKHNATAVGGTCASTITSVTVASENFDSVTAPAWPASGWNRSNTTGKVVTNATQRLSTPNSGAFVNTAGTTEYFERTFDLSGYSNAKISFWRYTANLDATVDFLRAAYSTNGGASWVDIYPASNANVAGGMVGPVSLPSVANVLVRFSGANNQANETIYIDDIVITGDTGTNCHNVADAAAIHNNSVPYVSQADTDLCTTCHTNNTTVPATLTCVDASCHAGIHNSDHIAVASAACLSCHSASNDVRIIHAGVGDGCNVCHGGGGYTDIHTGKSAECAQSGCHASETPVDPNHYTGTELLHTAGAAQENSTLGAWALSPACVTCHDMTLLSEHEASTAAKTSVPGNVCENCHLSTALPNSPAVVAGDWAARAGVNACIACHAVDTVTVMHGQTAIEGNHAVMNDTQSCASSGAGCHPVSNVAQVGTPTTTNNIHASCADCHGKSSSAHLVVPGALAQGCTGNAACHTVGFSTNNHGYATGDEAWHTASGMATDLDAAFVNHDTCAECHSATLGLAHKDTSTTADLGTGRTAWNATAQSTCRDCHNAPATTGYVASAVVVKGDWPTKTCDDCHTAKHGTYTLARHQSPAGSGCTLSNGCHGYTGATLDVRAVHDTAATGCTATGTDGKGWSGGCHALDKQMSTANMSCGSGATGQACHTNHTHLNHGPDHTYTTASDYTQTLDGIGSEAGCSNSGAGCHGTAGVDRDGVQEFHAAKTAGCVGGDKCHGSPTMTQAWKDGGSGTDCIRCHNNNFVNAKDTMPLYEASSAGHYGETTHTATAGLGTVSAGGSASAACSVCHDLVLRDAHGAAGGGFGSKTKGVYVTCQECHAYNAATSDIITTDWTAKSCAACHTAGVLGAAQVMHTATAPVVNGSSTAGCGAQGAGCHNTYDLHALHKNKSCTLAGCHDTKNKDMTAASKTCGGATGCHLNTTYTNTLHNGLNGDDLAKHRAQSDETSSLAGYVKPTTCTLCHTSTLKTAHNTTPSWTTPYCLNCHNATSPIDAVDVIKNTAWNNGSCSACHTVKHQAMSVMHDASVEGIGCAPSGSSEPTTVDLHREDFDGVTAPAWPATWTKGGSNPAQLVTTNSTSVSVPNSARFVASGSSAQNAYLQRTFDLSASDSPLLSFRYRTDFPVSVADEDLDITGVVTQGSWALSGGGTWDSSLDSTDTQIITVSANTTGKLAVRDTGVGTGSITNVTIFVRANTAGNERLTYGFDLGGTLLTTTQNLTTTYTGYSYSSPTKPGGGSWTWTDINNVQAHVQAVMSGGASAVNVDVVRIIVTYTDENTAQNYLRAEYSTNGGGSWTSLLNVTSTTGWTSFGPVALPQQANVLVRFTMGSNKVTQLSYLDDIVITHVVTSGGGGEGCHDVSDVARIHDTSTGPGCVACHTAPEVLPVTKTCSAVGCHATGADHDGLHQTTTASDYADGSGEGVESGCLNSGSGCHGATTLPANGAKTFHPASGCLDGACHLSASMTPAFKAASDGMECVRCHDGTFAGASDKIALGDADTAGHYPTLLHTATAGLGNVTAGGSATAACATCHDLGLKAAHSGAGFVSKTKGAKVTCGECHNYNAATTNVITTSWTTKACSECHASGVLGATQVLHGTTAPAVNGSSTAGCGASGAGCHSTYDLHNLHRNAAGGCVLAGCHDAKNKDMTSAAKTCGQATGCHTSATYNTTQHGTLTGADTTKHRAAGNASSNLGGYTQSTACVDCHSLTMRPAHDTRAGWTWPYCTSCHNQTTPINAVNVIKNTAWNNGTCEACHTTKHDTFGNHTATQSSGCTIGTCHSEGGSGTSRDVRLIHDRATSGCSAAGTDGKGWTGSCHALDKQMTTTAMSCGQGATGQACHTSHTHTNHGPDHDYTAASAYTQTADTIGSEAGCANSGTGCHVSASTGDAITTFHSAKTAGCTSTDKCHSSPTMTSAWKSGGSGADCSRCHNNNFVNAKDTMPLYEAASAGHYGETTHTATAGLGTLNAGGTASAACSVCHDLTLRNAHGANGGPFSSKTKGVYVTCQECHGYNAATSNIITTSWTAKSCAACHTSGVLGATQAMHSTTPPAVTGSSTASCGASGIGCHQTYELHALHKNAPGGCTLAGCHAKNKDMTSAAKNCGEATGCHLNTQFTATQHNGSTRGLINGTDTTHTAGATQMNATYTLDGKTAACSACHAAALFTEHNRSTSSLTGAGATKCLQCHNDSTTVADVVNGNWAARNTTTACSVCHANTDATSAATAHGFSGTNHTATSVTGCTTDGSALGAGCHGTTTTPSLTTVHTTGCALTRACHSPTVYNPGVKACTNASCHPTATYNTTTYAHGSVTGDEATHTVTTASMNTTLSYGTGTASAACSVCHSSTLKASHNPAAGYATNSLGGNWLRTNGACVGCHNATSPIDVAALVAANNWGDTCVANGCHNTTQSAHIDGGNDAIAVTGMEAAGAGTCNKSGCHTNVNLHELHKNRGCALTGCHVTANKDMRPTQKSCGTGGNCHVGYESGAHAVSSGGSACNTCHSSKTVMVNDTTTFHHVLDSATPYRAPAGANTYPTSTTALECVSCHTDHNNFNSAKGSNLRQSVSNANASAFTNTDFSSTSPYGICVSCHSTALTKSTSQKVNANRPTSTLAISGADYNTSAHNYVINDSTKVGFGTSAFQANCTKCHDDEQDTGSKMSSTYKLGLHYSAEESLLKALGVTLVGTNYAEENLCFKCHTGGNTAGPDGYGVNPGGTAMTGRSRNVQAQFAKTSKHNVAGYAGIHRHDEYANAPAQIAPSDAVDGWWGASNANKHVECVDCHNVHQAQKNTAAEWPIEGANRQTTTGVVVSPANKGVWGVNISGATNGNWSGGAGADTPTWLNKTPVVPTYAKVASVTYEWQLCLKCHSRYAWGQNTPPNVPSGRAASAGTSTMTDVGQDFNPSNYAYHPVFAQGKNQPSASLYSYWNTDADRRSIGGVSTGNGLSNTFVDGWLHTSRVTCSDCHGNNAWGDTRGVHGSSNKWILRGVNTGIKVTKPAGPVNVNATANAASFCNNCHRWDVYGGGFKDGSGDEAFSRASHLGGGLRTACDDQSLIKSGLVGCIGCHGGRPTDGGKPNGLIHGTALGKGNGANNASGVIQSGTAVGDPMGDRFCNGAAWDAHQTGKTGTIGCSTLGTADQYSSCTQHGGTWGKTFAANYNY